MADTQITETLEAKMKSLDVKSTEEKEETVFQDIDADKDIDRLSIMESLCMNCHENGETRMLLTSIPYFRDIIVLSFSCDHCGYSNTGTQNATAMQDKGVRYELKFSPDSKTVTKDLNRQVIRSERAVIKIPEMEFEIPGTQKKGEITTVEGIIRTAADALDATYLQSDNGDFSDEQIDRISDLVDWFREAYEGDQAFTFILEDLTGNSFIQNPDAPRPDPACSIKYITRTNEQIEALGFAVEDQPSKQAETDGGPAKLVQVDEKIAAKIATKFDTYFDVESRSAVLPCTCHCGRESETRMAITTIPKFKEVIIMCTECTHCGFKNSEVKPAGAISPLGTRTILRVTEEDDLKREVLKSDSAGVSIPEIELELMPGTLGGKYTTIEGLLCDIETQLKQIHTFQLGDSATTEQSGRMSQFMTKFKACQDIAHPFTLIIEDPLGNCYIGSQNAEFNLNGEEKADPALTIESFERTQEMNEDFGLADMNVDNYTTTTQDDANSDIPDREVDPETGGWMDMRGKEVEEDDSEDEEEDEEEDDEDDDELPPLLNMDEPEPSAPPAAI